MENALQRNIEKRKIDYRCTARVKAVQNTADANLVSTRKHQKTLHKKQSLLAMGDMD